MVPWNGIEQDFFEGATAGVTKRYEEPLWAFSGHSLQYQLTILGRFMVHEIVDNFYHAIINAFRTHGYQKVSRVCPKLCGTQPPHRVR
ncbi:hypothetical protein ABZ920_08305 [Streptomyces sp. NPDC046831]|uniref:hypothetical protein n=1 Tax=Streptomyces sp. NPDC046831 TaxID=3154805 RepID=UPI00340DAA43